MSAPPPRSRLDPFRSFGAVLLTTQFPHGRHVARARGPPLADPWPSPGHTPALTGESLSGPFRVGHARVDVTGVVRMRDPAVLRDRVGEREELERLISAVRAGQSCVLGVSGDPGVGKTALLEYLLARASAAGCRVARAVGVQSEMELAFAGLHQVCAPMLALAERLPAPQHEALDTAFGIATGPPPDRFLVGLAVLSLLSEVADERPLICVIDDAQWLDTASAQALGFTARRLAADPVGLVFAAREPVASLATLPELGVDGLREDDARALLESALRAPLVARVCDLIVAETRGNPLALLELPRGLTPGELAGGELAGGFGLPASVPLTGPIEDSFSRRMAALPVRTQRLLRLAAADPSGDRLLIWRAAELLDIDDHAAAAAVEAGLVEFGARVRFRHPPARSAAYRSATLAERQQLHAALAQATDAGTDPDRRAWHRAGVRVHRHGTLTTAPSTSPGSVGG